jgi:hypothetical protein
MQITIQEFKIRELMRWREGRSEDARTREEDREEW